MGKITKLLAICLLISTLSANTFENLKECEKYSKKQTETNYVMDREYGEYKNTAKRNIDRCNNEKKRLQDNIRSLKKERDKKIDWLVRIPFTEIGITVSFAKGFITGYVVAVIL